MKDYYGEVDQWVTELQISGPEFRSWYLGRHGDGKTVGD